MSCFAMLCLIPLRWGSATKPGTELLSPSDPVSTLSMAELQAPGPCLALYMVLGGYTQIQMLSYHRTSFLPLLIYLFIYSFIL